MHNYLVLVILFCLCSCQTHSSERVSNQSADTTSSADASITPDTLCFQQIMRRDTTTVRLVINGEQATGYLDINRYEKDRARGPFTGKVYPNHIRTDWQRSGEGVTEMYLLDMVRQGDTLSWREGEFIKNPNGKGWIAKEPSKGYQTVLLKIDCPRTDSQ